MELPRSSVEFPPDIPVDISTLDPHDPDAIAARPPPKAIEPRTYFQVGQHDSKWSEFDERGVPVRNLKKKKPPKKEREVIEAEYLDANRTYKKYLLDVQHWEQAKLDSEAALKQKDRLRWAFRQVGGKYDPIAPDEMETIVPLMGWKALPENDFKVVRKGLENIANNGQVELEDLRVYIADTMPIELLQERLLSEQLDSIKLEDLYSPRTWRKKLDENPPPTVTIRSYQDRKSGREMPSDSRKLSARQSARGASVRDIRVSTSDRGGSVRRSKRRGGSHKKTSERASSPRLQ